MSLAADNIFRAAIKSLAADNIISCGYEKIFIVFVVVDGWCRVWSGLHQWELPGVQ